VSAIPDTTQASSTRSEARRTLATRDAAWARALARTLARSGVRPNMVSVASVGCALAAGAALALSAGASGAERGALLVAAAVSIQLRLLCNLLDGMLAVEEGLKSRTGEIFNELPDRVADVLILVGAGYAVPAVAYGPALGWAAAVAALLTAYVRVLSGSLGLTQHFVGPMAKQHRMFTLTVAALIAAAEAGFGLPARAIAAGLAVILAGSIATVMRRTRRLLRDAEGR
jgi:phosphatidylglycerophosphate synthase